MTLLIIFILNMNTLELDIQGKRVMECPAPQELAAAEQKLSSEEYSVLIDCVRFEQQREEYSL